VSKEGKNLRVYLNSIIIVLVVQIFLMIDGIAIFAKLNEVKSFILAPEYGNFNAYVVVPVRATEIERYAADELAKYVKKITGTGIAVVKEKQNLEYFGFYIGQTEKGKQFKPPETSPYEGGNGFRFKSVPNGIVIAGGDDLSTLYGVYDFLEEYQGCSWFMPDELGEIVPQNKGVLIPENVDVTQIPDIPIRWMNSGDWALKNKMNVEVRINGHNVGVINRWNFHTYATLVPDGKYFEDHPEYFSLTETKRVRGRGERGQICTSNPEVVRLVTQHLIDEFKKDPSITFISLTANDWYGFCQCKNCKSQMNPDWINDREGVASNQIHIFNNEVARRVKKFYPEKYIKGGAYYGYLRYPSIPSYKPENNIAIAFTPHIHYCHNHPITDKTCPYIADFMKEYYKWSANTKHLQIFAYECLHGWAQLPWPMVHILKKDMPEYKRTGVEQFFTQAIDGTFEAYALNYYVASKLAWNSSLNVDDLVKEFCKRMYGSAGPAMERYFQFVEDNWEKNPNHVAYVTAPIPLSLTQFFPPDVLRKMENILKEAEAVDTDALSKKRINLIRVDFDYLRLVMNYIDAISKPFKGINQDDPVAMKKASEEAESIGKVLVLTIWKFLEDNYPSAVGSPQVSGVAVSSWARTGVESLLRTHNNPKIIPKDQH
jgi:hypothetical protein